MQESTAQLVITGIVFLAALVLAAMQVVWAIRCGDAGGTYIIPQNSYPVCVQAVKL